MEQTPQEITVWYVLPAIRMELAKALLAKGLNQTEIASILGITKAAVSQYLKSKRAHEISFPEDTLKTIEKSAQKIMKNKGSCTKEIQLILTHIKESGLLCDIHKQFKGECATCRSI